MIIHAAYAKIQSPVVALDGRDFAPTGKARPSFGPAPLASPPLNSDGKTQQVALLVQREILSSRRSRALRLSQSKAASDFEADLRAITHAILSHGCRE